MDSIICSDLTFTLIPIWSFLGPFIRRINIFVALARTRPFLKVSFCRYQCFSETPRPSRISPNDDIYGTWIKRFLKSVQWHWNHSVSWQHFPRNFENLKCLISTQVYSIFFKRNNKCFCCTCLRVFLSVEVHIWIANSYTGTDTCAVSKTFALGLLP